MRKIGIRGCALGRHAGISACRLLAGALLAVALALAGHPGAAQEAEDAQVMEPPLEQGGPLTTEPPISTGDETPAKCPVPSLRNWTGAEKYTWEEICARRWAGLPAYAEDTAEGFGSFDSWKPTRVLSAAFLLRIMTDPVYVAATPYTGIRIDGAHFPEAINLTDLEYNKPVDIINSVFTGSVRMERFRSRSRVRLAGSWFRYLSPPSSDGSPVVSISLAASGIEVAKGIDLTFIKVAGEVELTDANIGAHLDLSDSAFLGRVRLDRTRIGSMLFVQNTTIADSLVLDAADVGQNIVMTDFSIRKDLANGDVEYGQISASQLHVSGHLIIGQSDASISMPSRLVGQSAAAEAVADPAAQDPAVTLGAGAGQNANAGIDPADAAANLPAGDPAPPLPAGDLAAGTLAAGAAEKPPAPERTFSVKLWRIGLTGARIDGELRIRRLHLLDRITLEDMVVGDDLWLTETDVHDALFSAISVKGFVLLHGLHVTGSLTLDSGSFGRSIVMDAESRIATLRMPGAVIKGGVYFAGATVSALADLNSIAVDRDLVMGGGSTFAGPVDASFARVGGSLDLTGGHFVAVDLESSSVDRDMALGKGSTFSGLVNASFARIGGSLDLTGGRFASVDLTGADIAAELRLAAAGAVPFFARSAELNLRNATTNSLQDVAESWPCVLHLEGFTYQRQIRSAQKPLAANASDPCDQPAGVAKVDSTQPAATQPKDAAAAADAADEKRAGELVNWLSRQTPYSPQPYVQLANVLRQSGDSETAKAILFAGKEREWQAAGWWSKFLLSLQFAFTGFGLYPYVAGYWVLALIAIGTVVFSLDPSPELRRFTPTQRVIYSFDMLIPAVHLRHHHAEIELQSWPRYYLYGHKLMGYILLSFLAAALLGLGGLE